MSQTSPETVEALRAEAFKLAPQDQYRLAFFIAKNLGMVLENEDVEWPDDPRGHAQTPGLPTREDMVRAIEGRMVSFQGFSSPMLAGAIADAVASLSDTSTLGNSK